MPVKAIILIGGPSKGTRFRPLSLDLPKPLFPIAGFPILHHHIEACCKQLGSELKEIILLGFYDPSKLQDFIMNASREFSVPIKYDVVVGDTSSCLPYFLATHPILFPFNFLFFSSLIGILLNRLA
jgi:NDP-sugar pyrophosphorylase family protein